MHYYQFNITDWGSHTSHLTPEEEGIYLRLVNYYYDTEVPIPEETQMVIRRLRLGSHSETVGLLLSEFFTLTKKGWIHSRCEKEIEKYQKKAERNRIVGKKGGRPKKINNLGNNPEKTQMVSENNPNKTLTKNHKPRTINQEPLTNSKDISMCTSGARTPKPDWIDHYLTEFWRSYPKKVDKKKSIDRLRKMIMNNPDKQLFDQILYRVRLKAQTTDKQFWPSPDRYLRDEKWEDDIIQYGETTYATRKESLAERSYREAQEMLERLDREEEEAMEQAHRASHDSLMDQDGSVVWTKVEKPGG